MSAGHSSLPRILLSAYQCGDGMGSVSQIGWEWYSRLAARAPVTLMTHIRNRETLERSGAPLPGSQVIYIDTEWFAGPLYRTASRIFPNSQHSVFLLSSLDYFLYDYCAVRELRKRAAQGEKWDVVHAVTPVSPVAATALHRLGAPLVLGPWNGGMSTPDTFPEFTSADSTWLYPIRNVAKLFNLVLRSTQQAARILVATKTTEQSLPKESRARARRMLENGVDLRLFESTPWPAPPSGTTPLRVLFTGRLVPVKGVPMLLRAIAAIRSQASVQVTIIGDGPCKDAWQREAVNLGVANQVEFLGGVPLPRVAEELRRCHVFCLPSVRESGGAVLLEAMACGRPVIAVNYGGPAEIVDDSVGLAIDPAGREYVESTLASAFLDVIRRPEAWRERGRQGRLRAEKQYGWNAKIETALAIYQEVQRNR